MTRAATIVGTIVTVALLSVSAFGTVAVGVEPSGETAETANSVDDDYEVTLTDVEIETWRLVNVTVENVVVREIQVTSLETPNETAENVVFENVSLSELEVENGTLSEVAADELVVRNRSVLDVPGADLVGDISDQTIGRHVLTNMTIDGLVIGSITVENMTVAKHTVTDETTERDVGSELLADTIDEDSVDVNMSNATVEEADLDNVTGSNWEVERDNIRNETISHGDESAD